MSIRELLNERKAAWVKKNMPATVGSEEYPWNSSDMRIGPWQGHSGWKQRKDGSFSGELYGDHWILKPMSKGKWKYWRKGASPIFGKMKPRILDLKKKSGSNRYLSSPEAELDAAIIHGPQYYYAMYDGTSIKQDKATVASDKKRTAKFKGVEKAIRRAEKAGLLDKGVGLDSYTRFIAKMLKKDDNDYLVRDLAQHFAGGEGTYMGDYAASLKRNKPKIWTPKPSTRGSRRRDKEQKRKWAQQRKAREKKK
jgi:hypothetical protein